MTATKEKLAWKRSVKSTLVTGTCRRWWHSTCGRFGVEEHRRPNEGIRYLAMRFVRDAGYAAFGGDGYWDIISHHRTRSAAVAACERINQAREGFWS